MEYVTEIMSVVWSFIEKHKKCSVGITTNNGVITITLLWGKIRWKQFSNQNAGLLGQQIKDFLKAA